MFRNIDLAKDFQENVFSLLADRWMLVTAGSKERLNTMTASWGGLGVLWGKNVATVYVRPQRYTREFIDAGDCFTLSFFGEEYRGQLSLCGSKSGREIDKVKECSFTVKTAKGDAPFFAEAELVLVCRKLFCMPFEPAHFLSPELEKFYPEKDYHRMYIGEIAEVLEATNDD